jgi:hypothetical protein
VYEPWRIEISPEDLPRLTGRSPLYNTRVVTITGGLVLEKFYDPDDPVYGGLRWGSRHYLRQNVLLVRDAFGSYFWPVPLPADEFTFTVEREGPDFPYCSAPINIDDIGDCL